MILGGQYRLDGEIGRGRYGVVYRATHMRLNVERAVKVLDRDQEGVADEILDDYRSRFRTEIQLVASIDHPHLIKVYDLREDQSGLFAIMELAVGGSLFDLVSNAKRPLEINEVVRLLREAANGLLTCHEVLRVIHSDVKPSNILLSSDGKAKVADFGLAQTYGLIGGKDSRGSHPLQHRGTPDYTSPEHSNPMEPLTPSSDVYSLGCVAFELLTGQVWKQVRGKAKGPRDLRGDVPRWLDDIVRRMLLTTPGITVDDRHDRKKRFVDMRGVISEIDTRSRTSAIAVPATVIGMIGLLGVLGAAISGMAVGGLAPFSAPTQAVEPIRITPQSRTSTLTSTPTNVPSLVTEPPTKPTPSLTPTRVLSPTPQPVRVTQPPPVATTPKREFAIDCSLSEGVNIRIPATGRYRMSYVGGAYSPESGASPGRYVWRSRINAYINKGVIYSVRVFQQGDSASLQYEEPSSPDFVFAGNYDKRTQSQSEEAAREAGSTEVNLKAADVVTFVCMDDQPYFSDNTGSMRFELAQLSP